jgi:O-glycosyl hydrolase
MSARIFESLESRRLLAVNVTIDAATKFQTIDGFGTSLAWWQSGLYETEAWRDAYYQDLGSSMLRVDMNILALPGSDGNLATPVEMVEDLQTNIDQFDWNSVTTARFGGVAQVSQTKKLDDFKLIGTIWSPPHWMKAPQLNSDGKVKLDPKTQQPLPVLKQVGAYLNSVGGVLDTSPDNLEQFGRYVAAYVKGYEQHFGVPMYALSVANEPAFDQVGSSQVGFNSCLYDPATFVLALKAVGDAFDHYGITTKIMGPEATMMDELRFINAIRSDPAALADLDIYNLHGSTPASLWNAIKNDGKPGWMTETSGEAATWDGAMNVARNAQNAIVQGNTSAWLYWQMSDGGANASSMTLTSGADTTKPKYAAAKHFFRYVRPDSVRVAATPSDPNGVYVSAFRHDVNKTLTTVILNYSTTTQTINLTIGGTGLSGFNIARRSSSGGVWQDIGPIGFSNGVATFELPARSIITLQGATLAQSPFGGSPIVVAASPATIQAENFDTGGEGVAFHDVEKSNLGGKFRVSEAVDIQTTTDAGGGFNVGYVKAGEWLEYTIDVQQPGNYDIETRVASAGSNGKFHVEIDGVDKTGLLSIPNTGGWQNWTSVTKSGVVLAAGVHVMRVFMDAAGSTGSVGNFNHFTFRPGVPTPPTSLVIQAEEFDAGAEGVAYHDLDKSNQGGQYRNTGVDVQATTDAGGGFNIGYVKAGEWLRYTINLASAGVYTLDFRVAAGGSNGKFHLEADGVDVTGQLTVPNTGGWQTWTTVTKTGVSLSAGTHVLRLRMDMNGSTGSVGNFNWLKLTRT